MSISTEIRAAYPLSNTLGCVQSKMQSWFGYAIQASIKGGSSALHDSWGEYALMKWDESDGYAERAIPELQSVVSKVGSVALYALATYGAIQALLYVGAALVTKAALVGTGAAVLATVVGVIDPVSPIELMEIGGREKVVAQWNSFVDGCQRTATDLNSYVDNFFKKDVAPTISELPG